MTIALFMGGPLDGETRAIPRLQNHIMVQAVDQDDFIFEPAVEAKPPKHDVVAYRPRLFRKVAKTAHTIVIAEWAVYKTDESEEKPPLDMLRGCANMSCRIVPKPDFIREFNAWFKWQCFVNDAPLWWVRDEKERFEWHRERMVRMYS